MLDFIFYMIGFVVSISMIITFFKLLYLLFKHLFYYISDIFGSQNPDHDLAYQVPLVPFWVSVFCFSIVTVAILPTPGLTELLYVYSLSFIYITIYIMAMYSRYKNNIKRYDEIAKKNLDFIKICIFPVSGLITLVGFGLTATGSTLDTPDNMLLLMYKVIMDYGKIVERFIPSAQYRSMIQMFTMFIIVIMLCFVLSLPFMVIGYVFIRIMNYIAKNAGAYKELMGSMNISKKITQNSINGKLEKLRVKKPLEKERITVKSIIKTRYVFYETGKTSDVYNKYQVSKRICIGKECDDDTEMMIPNTNFVRLFPELIPRDGAETLAKSN